MKNVLLLLVLLLIARVTNAQQTSTISFPNPGNRTYTSPPFTLSATSNNTETPITFESSNPNVIEVTLVNGVWQAKNVNAGTVTITARQAASANYLEATPVSRTITVNKVNLYLTWTSSMNGKTYGDPPFELTAQSTSSESPIFFETMNPDVVSVANSTGVWMATIIKPGYFQIKARQLGSTNFHENWSYANGTINYKEASLVINEISSKRFSDPPFALTTASNSPAAVKFISSDPQVLSVSEVSGSWIGTIHKSGTVTLQASQDQDEFYTYATATKILSIGPGITTINFFSMTDKQVTDAPFDLTATSSHNETPITFESSNPQVVSVSNQAGVWKATIIGRGSASIIARQEGNERYSASFNLRSFAVGALNSENLVNTTSIYTNPAWLQSLSWSKLTDKPTTLFGYGITDAAPSIGSINYIQNQFSSPQAASIYLNGQAIIGSDLNPTGMISQPSLDLRANVSNGKLGAVLGRLPEGSTAGDGTYLGVRGHSTQVINNIGQKSFSLEHGFYGHINNSINFHRGQYTDGGYMTFNTNNNAERMRLSTEGNLLINSITDDMQNRLQVNGSVKSTGALEGLKLTLTDRPPASLGEYDVLTRNKQTGAIETTSFVSDPNGSGVINDANYVKTSGDQTITGIKTINGQVGFGTLTPKAYLDIASPLNGGKLGSVLGRLSEGEAFLGVRGHSTEGMAKSFSIEHGFYGQTNSTINFHRGDNVVGGYLTFNTHSNYERMRITSSGNMLIGTTSDDNTNKLQVNGGLKASGPVEVNQLTIKGLVAGVTEGSDVLILNNSSGKVEKAPVVNLIDQSKLVHTTGNETIGGIKTFSNNVNVSGTLSADNFSGSSSGVNTGDQDLSGYLTSSSATSLYQPKFNYTAEDAGNKVNNLSAPSVSTYPTTQAVADAIAVAKLSNIEITYTELISAINNSTLSPGKYYKITDYQTVHNIPGSSPIAVNVGPVEPLVVLATDVNRISENAYSPKYPTDEIAYSVANTYVLGATKGCILKRTDKVKNVSVSYDFRNYKCRRYKLSPPAWNSFTEYTRYQPVLYSDNAIYFCNKANVPAGDVPSPTSDNWVQMIPDNSYYLAISANGYTQTTSNNANNSVRNVVIPVNASDFVDLPFISNYDALTSSQLSNISLQNYASFNTVIQHKNQAFIMSYVDFHNTGSTTIVLDQGYMWNCNFEQGIASSIIFLRGTYIRYWDARTLVTGNTMNLKQLFNINGGFKNTMVRSVCQLSNFSEIAYSILPDNFREVQTTNTLDNFKFSTSATFRNVQVLSNLGINYAVVQGSYSNLLSVDNGDVYISNPIENKTFIGTFDSFDNTKHVKFQAMIDKAATANIIAWTGTEAVDLLKNSSLELPTDDKLVHTEGDESIGGLKTFTGNIGIGTSNTGEYPLAVKGTIRTQAIKVDPTIWYDKVFEPMYKLPSLKEVEEFVKQKQHLPDIPSEAEVKKNGIELADMNALLLKKIEELTLYMIQKDKEVKDLKSRLDKLERK